MDHAPRPKQLSQLQDLSEKDIDETFSKKELQKLTRNPDNRAPVEKILMTKTIRGKKKYFVKWLYLPNKFNSWVEDQDLKLI